MMETVRPATGGSPDNDDLSSVVGLTVSNAI